MFSEIDVRKTICQVRRNLFNISKPKETYKNCAGNVILGVLVGGRRQCENLVVVIPRRTVNNSGSGGSSSGGVLLAEDAPAGWGSDVTLVERKRAPIHDDLPDVGRKNIVEGQDHAIAHLSSPLFKHVTVQDTDNDNSGGSDVIDNWAKVFTKF